MSEPVKRTNCFMHAFDVVNRDGGYICIGMSTRANPQENWNWQHFGNYDNQSGVFSSFVPPGDLDAHWKSFFTFEGSVVVGDTGYRRPMKKSEMARGVTALFFVF